MHAMDPDGKVQRDHLAEFAAPIDVHQFGPRLCQLANRGDVTCLHCSTECLDVQSIDMLFELCLTGEPV